jgi:hypothetical protein
MSVERHSLRARRGPGVARIASGAVGTGVISGTAVWTVAGVPASPQAVTGFLFGIALATVVAVHTVALMTERERARRRVLRQESRAEREHREIAENTGSWDGPDGLRLTVRWDVTVRGYWVSGWVWDQNLKPAIWPNLDDLASYLVGIEAGGWIARDDIGTRGIRAKLDLPGWDVVPGQVMDLILEQGEQR